MEVGHNIFAIAVSLKIPSQRTELTIQIHFKGDFTDAPFDPAILEQADAAGVGLAIAFKPVQPMRSAVL
jgi:hypothetical protein